MQVGETEGDDDLVTLVEGDQVAASAAADRQDKQQQHQQHMEENVKITVSTAF